MNPETLLLVAACVLGYIGAYTEARGWLPAPVGLIAAVLASLLLALLI